jgi:broad specificity phosphatase PhoE
MKIFLVRHGQSLANKKRIHQGNGDEWKNTPLSNTGKTQARKIAEKLKNENFDKIYSSSLKRAKQTAEIINKFHNKKIIFDERIKEHQNYMEGKDQFVERVNNFFEDIKKENKNILIVSHGGVIMTFLAISTGNRETGGRLYRRNCIGTGNTSMSVLEKIKEDFKITELNYMSHLSKRYILKHKVGLIWNLPYQVKPFIKTQINKEIDDGDCRHKSELLKQLFEEEGFKARIVYAVFDWKDLPIPKDILGILKSGTKMVHNLLEVNLNGKWIKVDATWNRDLQEKGFPITKHWNGKENTKMVTEGKINFYKSKEEAKKEEGINNSKEELHKFAEKLNKWIIS